MTRQFLSAFMANETVVDDLKAKMTRQFLSAFMANETAQAGFRFTHLKLAAQRKGEDGLRLVLQEHGAS